MKKKPFPLWHPRNWPFWLLIGLLWLLAHLPYKLAVTIGKYLGRLIYRIGGKARRTASINLSLCFPELSTAARELLLLQNFEATGISLIETAFAWWGAQPKLQPLLQVHGLEHLTAALAKGNGVIMCSAHFLTLELAGRLLAAQQPFAVIYRPQKNPVLDTFAKQNRRRIYQQIIARGDLRAMLRLLKNNGIVWYTPDIDAGRKNSIFVPFFNVPAATITATSRLAQRSNAAVLPAFPIRRKDNSGYDVYIHPPLENYPTADPEQDAMRINQIIEAAVRQAPEQYLWQYKRFKTRMGNEARFYD